MDYHLDRRLRLKPAAEIEHRTLYKQAIVEIDDRGAQAGNDQIPWRWALSFRATEIVVTDSVSYDTGREMDALKAVSANPNEADAGKHARR